MKKLILKNIAQTLVAVGFLLLVWVIAYFAVGNELLIPSLPESLSKMGELIGSASFWRGVGFSLLRATAAFVISFALALIFAVIAYLRPLFRGFFAPIASAFRSLPVLAVLLILLSFLGAGVAPVAVAFLSLFPMLYTAILTALLGIDKQLIEAAKACGTPVRRRVTALYLPLSAPAILRESGGALSFSLKLIVSAEVLAQTAKSLGGMMQEARVYAEIPQLFALVSAAFIVGLLLELALTAVAVAVERKIS